MPDNIPPRPVKPLYVPDGISKEEFKEMSEMMNRIESVLKKWKERNKPINISVPEVESTDQPGMFYFILKPGTTVFDFLDGRLIEPSKDTRLLRTALRMHGQDYMHSLMLFTDRDLLFNMDGESDTMMVGGETRAMSEQQFQQVYITVREETNIRLYASTSDHPIDVNLIAPPVAYEGLYDASTAVRNTITIDLGVFSKTILEICATATVAVPFTFEASMDKVHWFTIESFGATTSLHKGYANAFRYVRLTATAGGAGTLNMLIVATSSK